ncbi:hypothetical protein QFZ82_001997 [Streptomyces sp. V4I23]|uniref:hypothetical protein n=1 Tax=Streptomyces sp. V4I23 TaxID=3042282 RepID=UPI00278785D1|nr:hypothetical protein [Streptomyces sp. V4I23]MDQ1007512.1 hypothetical protein [Streptomyces sp. V4I23]
MFLLVRPMCTVPAGGGRAASAGFRSGSRGAAEQRRPLACAGQANGLREAAGGSMEVPVVRTHVCADGPEVGTFCGPVEEDLG